MGDKLRSPTVYHKIIEFGNSGQAFATAVVLKAEGSTPQKVGARAIVEESGQIWGTIGGGAVEAEAQRRAVQACKTKRPVVFNFHLEGADAGNGAPICGGIMRVLIDPTAAKDRAVYARAADALDRGKRGVLLITIRTCCEAGLESSLEPERHAEAWTPSAPAEMMVRWIPEEAVASQTDFPGAEAIRSSLVRETAQVFAAPSAVSHQPSTVSRRDSAIRNLESKIQNVSVVVLVEPVMPRPRLLIVGGGHIGQALARQAVLIDFDVTVIDDRPEFATPSLFPGGVTTRCGDIAKEVTSFLIADDTYIVIVTRGHTHDAEALAACIHRPAAYVGMIGSRRKVALMRKDFVESGRATEEEFNRVFAPVGLDIGALTVPEIAASITAQLIAVRRKGRAPLSPAVGL